MDFTLGLVTGMYAVVAVIIFYVVYVIEVKLGMPSLPPAVLLLDNNSIQFNSIHSLTHFLHTHHMPHHATLAGTFHFSIVHRRFVFLTIVLTIELRSRLVVVFLDQQ